ncbi:MAG: NADH-quinone oxidoreductase subunit K [Oscillospiraceae bacterium]|nr:NADH-quinone oxidoreductase subunit K [Oscillospiraceae bacterium]
MGSHFFANYEEMAAMVLFAVGLITLLLHPNLIKKIIGLNIMDTAAYLLLASMGYIEGHGAPIITEPGAERYINPIPSGLVLTGIVVSVSVSAVMMALAIRLYRRYRTLNLDEIYMFAQKERE